MDGDRLTRLFVHVQIGERRISAVIDTGGAFLVVDPGLAETLGFSQESALIRDTIRIRGVALHGAIHRIPLTLLASSGEPLTFEATAFVPDLDDGEHWPLPSYLGWQGCLERIRFAVDPGEEVIYFGALRS